MNVEEMNLELLESRLEQEAVTALAATTQGLPIECWCGNK